jgi:ectoine hydroxylase-related dioxygenase (phytanoyl-CoA dioxygenase family)
VVDPLLLSLLETIFESDHFLLSSTVGSHIGTEEEAQVPHRDDGKYPIARPHQELVMNMIIAVDEFTEANGGTVLFEGSHKWLYEGENNYATKNVLPNTHVRLSQEENELEGTTTCSIERMLETSKQVSCVMPPGSILLYRGSLLHGGGANRSNEPRLGILIEYIQAWLRPQETHLLGVEHDIVRSLPSKLQEMLGWTVTPPFLGYVDGRHPKRILERTSKL